ncbi:hypothetical protein [Xenorhabdus budapestensis]|uniref:Uncharacterized protein n=1 Tax=Xenorhabdus budapestensis TaxID=290110 RepID=A0A2D0IML0_XENBU|nr:hypothetical protein [Xenorhabdus budapestensis]PHM23023.1 hypothetical protein Xbud_03672 [Xenorhabdus budapestensis]
MQERTIDSDNKPNYEAIGRCKLLKEKIAKLIIQRSESADKLSDEIMHLKGHPYSGEYFIPKFDIDYIHKLLEKIAVVNTELVQTVNKFNFYCQDASELPLKFTLSHRKSVRECGRAGSIIGMS